MFLSDTGILKPQSESVTYDPSAGRYRDKSGRFVSFVKIEALANQEIARTKLKLRNLTKNLYDGKIDLSQWETRFATELKNSHIRLTILAQGGKKRTALNHYGIAGRKLREEYAFLNNFANQIYQGKVSDKEALNRAQLYAQSAAQTFYESHNSAKIREGFTEAKRTLSSNANHCPDCPGYSTNGNWIAIALVVPKGKQCACRGRCQCIVEYR